MPLHDWTRVDVGLYHDFHQGWTVALSNVLNGGVLPSDYFALIEQASASVADVVNVGIVAAAEPHAHAGRALAVAPAPPRTSMRRRTAAEIYAGRANRIAIRRRDGRLVALVQVVSPGNKASPAALRALVTKLTNLLCRGVHLLVIDMFPTGPHDALGIQGAIWESVSDEPVARPPKRARTLASYNGGESSAADVRFVAVGDALPDMPLFLKQEVKVQVPLDASYRTAWAWFPSALRGLRDNPKRRA